MNERETKEQLRQWVLAGNKKIAPEAVSYDTPIMERRIVTSLQVLDLILLLERMTGVAVDVEHMKPGSFESINTIYNTFCKGAQHGG